MRMFAISLIASVCLTALFALSAYEIRLAKKDQLGLEYKARYDYYFIYGWMLLSAAVSALIIFILGGKP